MLYYMSEEAQEGRDAYKEKRDPGLRQVPAPPVTGARASAGPAAAGLRRALLRPALLPTMRAFAIPMRTKFRGITVREGALIEGPGRVGGVLAVRRVRAAGVGALAGQRDRVGDGAVAGIRSGTGSR